MKRSNRVEVNVSDPAIGLITRFPDDTDAKKSALRGLTVAENIRCDAGVVRNGPGYEKILNTTDFDSTITKIFQSNISSQTEEISKDSPIIGTKSKLYAISRGVGQPPTVDAGSNQILTNTTFNLVGMAFDLSGVLLSNVWSLVSGPAGSVIASPTSLTTSVTVSTIGTYIFQLTSTNVSGVSISDTVTVTVVGYPFLNAGVDQMLYNATTATLVGTASDASNLPLSILWTQLSGPAATITSPTSLTTTVTGLSLSTYVFRLAVGNGYLTSTNDITIDNTGSADEYYLNQVFDIKTDPNTNKIYVLAEASRYLSGVFNSNGYMLIRYNTTTSRDTGFAPVQFNQTPKGLFIDSSSSIFVVGDFTMVSGFGRNYSVKLNSSGTLDGTYLPSGIAAGLLGIEDVGVSGKLLVYGSLSSTNVDPTVGSSPSLSYIDTTTGALTGGFGYFTESQSYTSDRVPVAGVRLDPVRNSLWVQVGDSGVSSFFYQQQSALPVQVGGLVEIRDFTTTPTVYASINLHQFGTRPVASPFPFTKEAYTITADGTLISYLPDQKTCFGVDFLSTRAAVFNLGGIDPTQQIGYQYTGTVVTTEPTAVITGDRLLAYSPIFGIGTSILYMFFSSTDPANGVTVRKFTQTGGVASSLTLLSSAVGTDTTPTPRGLLQVAGYSPDGLFAYVVSKYNDGVTSGSLRLYTLNLSSMVLA